MAESKAISNVDHKSGENTTLLGTSLWLMKLAAMWPSDTNSCLVKYLMRIYLTKTATCMGLCSIGLIWKVFKTNDLVDRSEAIDIFTLTISALYKQLFFVVNHNKLNEVVMEADQLVFPEGWMEYAPKLSIVYCFGGFLTISLWALCPVLKVLLGTTTWSQMNLPMNIYEWEPFNGWKYVTLYLGCGVGLIVSTHVYLSIDGFLFSSVHAATGALKVLENRFTSIRSIQCKDKLSTDEARVQELTECVRTHVFIIKFLKKLDILFRSMIVVDILHAIISLSFAMLQISESKGVLEWIKMTFFIAVCFLHQYLNSYFGQELIDSQESLHQALEDIPWEEGSRNLRLSTLFIMSTVSEPIKLSAWRIYFLQYATFAEFVKNMISTYMVLRQVLDKAL